MCETTTLSNALSTKHRQSSATESRDKIRLRGVDSVDIAIIVDNSIDLLLTSNRQVTRPFFAQGWSQRPQLVAEHGYSILFTFRKKGDSRSFLYDTGLTPETIIHNLDTLRINLTELQTIVLSHGHIDHHGGLLGLVRRMGKRNLPLVLHPDAWRNRKVMLPSTEWELPPPYRRTLEKEDVQIVEERGPSMLLNDEALVTGQVERVTGFEIGVPGQFAEQNGDWTPDPWVWDDQGLICHVNGKGLVIVSGCSHSGAVNIIRNAQKITGVDKIHAFVGGLHLPGIDERIIPQTIQELEIVRPDVIVPGHCTGWRATQEIARRLPEAFIQSSVGTQIHLE